MRRRRVNSRQERGAAKVGRESRPERSNSVYTGRLRARRLGARARGFASSRYVSTSKYLTTAVHRYMVGGRRWAMGTCRPPSLPHVRTASMQHAHARVDAPAHTHIFFFLNFCATRFFFVDGTEMQGKGAGTGLVSCRPLPFGDVSKIGLRSHI